MTVGSGAETALLEEEFGSMESVVALAGYLSVLAVVAFVCAEVVAVVEEAIAWFEGGSGLEGLLDEASVQIGEAFGLAAETLDWSGETERLDAVVVQSEEVVDQVWNPSGHAEGVPGRAALVVELVDASARVEIEEAPFFPGSLVGQKT